MKGLYSIIFIVALAIKNPIDAQEKKNYNVAIIVHDEVELFDFAGPGEVFSSANSRRNEITNFNVFTVAPEDRPITSMSFLKVTPNYSIDNAPDIDILIIPGGSTGVLCKDERFMQWVTKIYPSLDYLLTVCTGSHVPAVAGLLEGLQVTTHHSNLGFLSQLSPTSEVLANTKFVDSDKIITSGGVSSGIEGSLHLLRRIAGLDVAKSVANYMEYDHWSPDLGLISVENKNISDLKNLLFLENPEKISAKNENFKESLKGLTAENIQYGDLELLGDYLLNKNQPENALQVFQRMIDIFPKSKSTYSNLSRAYALLGIDAPVTQEEFFRMIAEKGGDYALQKFKKWHLEYPDWKMFNQQDLNSFGYRMVANEQLDNALAVFKVQVLAFPDYPNPWDSLGEIYLILGNKKEAMINYEKALEINPNFENAKKMIEKIKNL